MDVREKLARLNPTTVKFDTGHGGVAELTNQDIAAALAFVPQGLGREVLEACWWPWGAAIRANGLRNSVMAVVGPELTRQSRRVSQASLDLQLAEAAILWGGNSVSAEARAEVDRCRSRLAVVRGECWPNNTAERLPLIAKAIVSEIHGHRCTNCNGTGKDRGENSVCKSCEGSGNAKILDAWRAAAIKVDPSDFPKRWKRVYEWLFAKMRDAEAEAGRALEAALRREAA